MKSDAIRTRIKANATEVVQLRARIFETALARDRDPAAHGLWTDASGEFHQRYNALAFPGGYTDALEKFRIQDPTVIETALCFLEVRPYFFRSGYMFQVLLRRVKRAPLTPSQRSRLDTVLARRAAWRSRKGRHET